MSSKLTLFFFPLYTKMHTVIFLLLLTGGQKKGFCSLQDIMSAWYSHLQ